MLSLSLEQWLLAGVGVMMAVGLLVIRRQQQHIRRLEKLGAAQQGKLQLLQENQEAMNQSVVGMGRKLRQLGQRLAEAEQRSLFTPGDEASYQQAARLVSLGATARDLVENCGMARAEAELLVTLKSRTH